MFSCPSFLHLSFPLLSLSPSEMHSITFVLVPVARPIVHVGHGHRIINVVKNKRAGNPPVISSISIDLPVSSSTPVSNDVPNDVPKSDAESSTPIVKPSSSHLSKIVGEQFIGQGAIAAGARGGLITLGREVLDHCQGS